jgi:hypothetical protein
MKSFKEHYNESSNKKSIIDLLVDRCAKGGVDLKLRIKHGENPYIVFGHKIDDKRIKAEFLVMSKSTKMAKADVEVTGVYKADNVKPIDAAYLDYSSDPNEIMDDVLSNAFDPDNWDVNVCLLDQYT